MDNQDKHQIFSTTIPNEEDDMSFKELWLNAIEYKPITDESYDGIMIRRNYEGDDYPHGTPVMINKPNKQ